MRGVFSKLKDKEAFFALCLVMAAEIKKGMLTICASKPAPTKIKLAFPY